jgi:hypothetical protein
MIREEAVVTTRVGKRAGSERVGLGGLIVLAGIVVSIIRRAWLGYERRHKLAAGPGKVAASILALVHQEAAGLLRSHRSDQNGSGQQRTAAAKWAPYRPTSRVPAPVCHDGFARAER